MVRETKTPVRSGGRLNSRVAARLAWLVCGLTLALIACAVAFAVPNGYDLGMLSILVAEAAAALVGGLVASRRPRNPVGWIVAGHALCFTLGEFTRQYAIYGLLTQPGSLPLARASASPPYWVWFPGIVLVFSLLPLYFPDGRLITRRWRPVTWLAVLVAVMLTTFAVVRPGGDETRGIPNPLGIENLESFWGLAGVLDILLPASWLLLGAASVASLVVRFRRSRGEERQQIKWFVYAMVLVISYSLADMIFVQDFSNTVSLTLGTVILTAPWIAIAAAILKRGLYDIDMIINLTLVYGSLTATLVALYFGGIVALQRMFVLLTGEQSTLAVVASTLAIAALFNPLRRWVQASVDRRFYRRKYDAAKTLGAFNARLREETDLDALGDDLVEVASATVQPQHVSLWLRRETASKAGARTD